MLPQSFYGLRTSGISGGSYLAYRDLQGGSKWQEPPPLQMPGCKQASKPQLQVGAGGSRRFVTSCLGGHRQYVFMPGRAWRRRQRRPFPVG